MSGMAERRVHLYGLQKHRHAPWQSGTTQASDGMHPYLELSEASLSCCAAVMQSEGCNIAH